MRFIDSASPEYAAVTAYAARRSPTGLVREVDEPSRRLATITGTVLQPRSLAILSSYSGTDRILPGSAVGLYLVDANGEDVPGTLVDITRGEPFSQIGLVESFDRRCGHVRTLVDALSDVRVLVSPASDVITAYTRIGFEPIDVCTSIPGQPLMTRRSR